MEKTKTIAEQLEEVTNKFCDEYCKYPEQLGDEGQEILDKICDSCPAMLLF